jgi:hypothetical protein
VMRQSVTFSVSGLCPVCAGMRTVAQGWASSEPGARTHRGPGLEAWDGHKGDRGVGR